MTSDSLALGPDSRVGSYRLVKEIGRGGMGTVYEAVHTVLPRRAAIKVMHSDLRRQPGMATRMVQEASILEDIRHPGIARVYECNVLPDHRPWIAMELVLGETLASRLHYATKLPPLEVATMLAEIADVLASVHARGVVHRDLKPDNLLLTPSDRDFPLRVIDWGVARLGTLGRMTLDGMTPGTPLYMSPEQATGKDIGPPCDIYSLGVIAYETLVGQPPFDGRTLAEVVCMHLTSEPTPLSERIAAPADLCNLVHRMLEKDSSLRPGAIEIRQIARAIAVELAQAAYEEFEVVEADLAATAAAATATATATATAATATPARARPPRAAAHVMPSPPSDECVIVDPDALEFGVTEMLPVVRKPRWTPEIGPVTHAVTEHHPSGRTITPKGARDQVAGEIILLEKRR